MTENVLKAEKVREVVVDRWPLGGGKCRCHSPTLVTNLSPAFDRTYDMSCITFLTIK